MTIAKEIEQIARELSDICVNEYNDVIKYETIAVANEKAWKAVATLVNQKVVEGRIDSISYYLGYDKSVDECVRKDAEKQIADLKAGLEKEQ